MANRVVLNAHGQIEQHFTGQQTEASLHATIEQTRVIAEQLVHRRRVVRLLVDISELERPATSARKVAVQVVTKLSYNRLAVYGATNVSKALFNLIAYASGKSKLIGVFKTRHEAVAWLEKYATN